MLSCERPVLVTCLDARRIQGGGLRAIVYRVPGSIRCRHMELIERVNRDQLVSGWHPVAEGLHSDVNIVIRRRLCEAVRGEVLVESRCRTAQRHGLGVGVVSQPGGGLVALGRRHIPERQRSDRNDNRQGDKDHGSEGAPKTLACITRGDAEYYSPSPHPCVESAHQVLGAASASRSLRESPRERSTIRPSRRNTVRSAHAAILAS